MWYFGGVKKILFVCSGCTCRSPMAVYLARTKIKNNKLVGVEADCRGLFVVNDAVVEPKAMRAMELLGVPTTKRIVPKELCKKDLEECDYCFCMTPEHKAIIDSKFGVKVKTIAEAADFVEIRDPFGGSQEDYIAVAKQLDYAIDQIFERIFRRK